MQPGVPPGKSDMAICAAMPDRAVLCEAFTYCARTGALARSGELVGKKSKTGYLVVTFQGKNYLAHRLIWHIVHGDVELGHIDHINGDRADNRASNLRLVDRQRNAWNKKTSRSKKIPVKGIRQDSRNGRYRADIVVNGRCFNLGRFNSPEKAADAYRAAAIRKFGFFANDGAPTSRERVVSDVARSFTEWRKAKAS